MANSYRKVNLQAVFAVKNRQSLLYEYWRNDLFAYTAKSLTNRGHYCLAVNGSYDHVHLFFDYSCMELIPDLVREIKKTMSNFIKGNKLTKFKFEWQAGYGIFSHGYKEKGTIIKYIMNQKEHHKHRTFREEYLSLLENFEIDFAEEFLFDFLE